MSPSDSDGGGGVKSHLAAHAEGLQGVEAQPATVAGLPEAVHELRVERSLDGRQSHQHHMLLLGGELVSQHVVASPANPGIQHTRRLPRQHDHNTVTTLYGENMMKR